MNRIFNRWLEKKFEKVIDKSINDLTSIQILKLNSRRNSADFIQSHIQRVMIFSDRPRIQDYALDKSSSVSGDILEFGILGGKSLTRFDAFIRNNKLNKDLYGFDSFLGLGESWTAINAYNEFDLDGKLPSNLPKSAKIVVGDVNITLPTFLKTYNNPISLVHIDTDAYAPAKSILKNLKGRFQKGTIVLFDDYHSLTGWEFGEHLALQEELDKDFYRYLAFGPHQAAIEILQ